jgi:hypothetical protein
MTKRKLSQAPALHFRPAGSRGWTKLDGVTSIAIPESRPRGNAFDALTFEFDPIDPAVLGLLDAAARASRREPVSMMLELPDGSRRTWRARVRKAVVDHRFNDGNRPLRAMVSAAITSRPRRIKPA